jgi:hypothetical protein
MARMKEAELRHCGPGVGRFASLRAAAAHTMALVKKVRPLGWRHSYCAASVLKLENRTADVAIVLWARGQLR